jgi:hypothetical protein
MTDLNPAIPTKEKKKRSHIPRACLNCQILHVSCDQGRPCKRCVERHKNCVEGESKRKAKTHMPNAPEGVNANVMLNNYMSAPPPHILPETAITAPFVDTDFSISPEMFGEIFELPPLEVKDENSPGGLSSQFFDRILNQIKRRLPERTWFLNTVIAMREAAKNKQEAVQDAFIVSQLFQTELAAFSNIFGQLGIASIIWEPKYSVIHYVNQAYKDLTGFDTPLPTAVEALAFPEELSNDGLRAYMDGGLLAFGNLPSCSTFSFKTGLKLVHSPGEYVEGMMCVSIKRDHSNNPLLFLGNFMPFPGK